jgi:hypothetical protein
VELKLDSRFYIYMRLVDDKIVIYEHVGSVIIVYLGIPKLLIV